MAKFHRESCSEVSEKLSTMKSEICNEIKSIDIVSTVAKPGNPTMQIQSEVSEVSKNQKSNQLLNVIHEIKQQEEKKENLVITMVKESDDPKWESRQDHDKTLYRNICTAIGVGDHQIKKIHRLGKKQPESTRPLFF